jgi:multidrug efflux pump subunit AcrB
MLNIASRARPYFGAVLLTVVLLTAGGIYSATRMPLGVYPEVTFPRIVAIARVPGLAVPNMEVQVTRPIEQEVMSVIGATRVRSKTIRGASEIHIDFDPSTDMRWAKTDAWNRINAIRSELPATVELTVEQMTPSINPILSVVLIGGDNPSQLRDYAFYQLAPQIKNIPDVLYANVAGGDLREIEVEARPDDLFAADLSAADLADQIAKVHRLQPAGRIESSPLAFQILVNTQGQTAKWIEDLIISTKNNQPLRVRDVADVRVGHQDRLLSIGFGGKDAVVITVFRRLGGNTVNISRDIAQLLDKTGLSLPRGAAGKASPRNIQATMVYDQADFVRTAVDNVRDAIIIGGLFSILILLAFLRSWRATLISALAIPTTLAITFLFLHWAGETLNLMSLGGLAVAIGLIIDDTVVVMENIARHLVRKPETRGSQPEAHGSQPAGLKAVDPIDAASSEITGAVIGSTLTTVLVFLPLAFIVGVYGQFFASLSWSLAIAVLVSMVISLTIVPVAAAKFLAGRPMPEPGPIYRFLANGYELLLAGALKFPWVTLAFSLAAVVVGVVLYTGIPGAKKEAKEAQAKQEGKGPEAKEKAPEEKEKPPEPWLKGLQTGLMPAMDEGAFILDYWAPSGTPLAQTEEILKEVEQTLLENPDVESYLRRTGAENGVFATQTYKGDFQVILRPAEEDPISLLTKPVRPKFSDVEKELKEMGMKLDEKGKDYIRTKYRRLPDTKIRDEIEDEIKEHFSEHQLKIELIPIMQDELNDLSGASRPIEVKIFGPDYKQLRELAEKVGATLEKKGKGRGFKEVNSNVLDGNPDLMVEVNGSLAARMGLTPEAVERQLKVMYLGQVATQVRESAERITDVRVRYPDRLRFGYGRFNPQQVLDQLILLPEPPAGSAAAAPDPSPIPVLQGPDRAQPLKAMARLKPQRTPEEQWRENQLPAIFVHAEQNEEEAGIGAMVADIRNWLGDMEKQGAFPARYHWDIGGYYVQQQAAFRSLFIVMIVAIFLVFIMLAFQFGSIALPLLIFLTQPLSLVSGLFALWITNTPLNVSSYMGAILLIGLDMKNGILLVEYIQQLRREGMELKPALLLAGRTRFRPILMTSLAAILGLFPLALGIGPGAQMQQPLAIMVIGGLTANMLFTRVIIPVGYEVLERRKKEVVR